MFAGYAKDMREIDKRAFEEYKIPTIILMENAARALYDHVKELKPSKVTIACGKGNNGGDGFALARLLIVNGYETSIFCFGDIDKISGDAKVNLDILINMGIKIKNNLEDFKVEIQSSDAVVDAIFGTGLAREVSGIYKDAIESINKYSKYTVSVDIPSGINSDTGEKLGACVMANDTLTFGCMKVGLLLGEGRDAAGNVIADNISIPVECIEKQNTGITTNYGDYPLNLRKNRERDTNKGSFGRVCILGGSFDMSGAVALAARGALRSGAGLVSCAVPESILGRVGSQIPETTFIPLGERNGHMEINKENMDRIINWPTVLAFGVGMGVYEGLPNQLGYILDNFAKPIVIDADGLNGLCSIKEKLKYTKAKVVLTPHPGEMSRLTGLTIDYINRNRISVAKEFAKEYRCTLLLKGSSTVVTDGNRVYINTTGNPGMATGGSGDVLTGIIASFIAQGYNIYNAIVISCYIHGRAGDEAYNLHGFGLTPGDITSFLGNYIKM